MADLSITVANVSPSSQAIVLRQYPFGAAVTQGQVVYLDANNRWQLVDADASATGNGVADKRGIALNAGTNTQPAEVVIKDPSFTLGAAVANGVSYYASPNAGGIEVIANVGSSNYPTFLGAAISTTKINLNPTAAGIALA